MSVVIYAGLRNATQDTFFRPGWHYTTKMLVFRHLWAFWAQSSDISADLCSSAWTSSVPITRTNVIRLWKFWKIEKTQATLRELKLRKFQPSVLWWSLFWAITSQFIAFEMSSQSLKKKMMWKVGFIQKCKLCKLSISWSSSESYPQLRLLSLAFGPSIWQLSIFARCYVKFVCCIFHAYVNIYIYRYVAYL